MNFDRKNNTSPITLLLVVSLLISIYYNYQQNQERKLVKNFKLPQLNNRVELGCLLNVLNFETMIEIGVQRGHFAQALLNQWPSFKKYYGVDPWTRQANYIDSSNNADQDTVYKEAKSNLQLFGNRIELIREISTNALKYFHNNSIDFIYLDARHDYCAVTEDLENYYPKLKCGGIMAGHDFLTVSEQKALSPSDDYGICADGKTELKSGGAVKGAVLEFISRHKIEGLVITKEPWPSYYFYKQC